MGWVAVVGGGGMVGMTKRSTTRGMDRFKVGKVPTERLHDSRSALVQ